jgi:hypothetical protein
MAEDTITGREALFAIGEEVGSVRSEYLSSAASTTSLVVLGISLGQTTTFKYALARVLGKGIRQVTAYNDASQTLTIDSALSTAGVAGEIVDVLGWNGTERGRALWAANEAIRMSWPFFYRERVTGTNLTGTVAKTLGSAVLAGTGTSFTTELVVGDIISVPGTSAEIKAVTVITSDTSLTVASTYANTASAQTASLVSNITLAAATDSYTLPASCDGLLAIGLQPDTAKPIYWVPPQNLDTGQEYWRMEGAPGAYRIRFLDRFNREGGLHEYYTTQVLALWYAVKEPALTAETGVGGVTMLPSEYFSTVAAEIYRRRVIGQKPDGGDERTFMSLQQMAQLELQRLGIGKRPPSALVSAITSEKARADARQIEIVTPGA